jgi:serine/threonine-protein kinase
VAQTTTVLESGTELAGFRIESFIAQGEMGTVYRATQVRRDREVALKVLSVDRSDDPEFQERFLRESKRAASLSHPNVLPVYGVGEADGVIYLAMRYVPGSDLGRLLQEEGRLSVGLTLEIGRQIALALGAAHSERLVHGNVKPTNILLGEDDRAYLADFGLERRANAPGATRTGTTGYSAPEQLDGSDEVDRRADIYSLGCVLYHCLAGQPPYSRDGVAGAITAYVHDPVPPLTRIRPDLPPAVSAIVSKAIEKDRSNRYSTAPELAAALGAVLADVGGTEMGPKPSTGESDRGPTAEAPSQTPAPLVAEERSRALPWRRVAVVLLALAIVAAVLGGIFAFGSGSGSGTASSGTATAGVPTVIKLRAVRAERELRRVHLVPLLQWGPSSSVRSGLVYGTHPGAGARLPIGSTVRLLVSTGKPESAVPFVVGTNLKRTKRKLARAHLKLIVKPMPSGNYPIGHILRQNPGRGGFLPAGGTMTLWVSTGPSKVLVPDVRGESAQQAMRDLRNAGFRVRNAGPSTPTSNSGLAGTVAGQSPAGVKAPKNTVVILYLYYYVAPKPPPPPPPPRPVTYPSTIGVT